MVLLVFSRNFVPKTHHFWDIRLQKWHDLENRVMGPSRSLDDHVSTTWRRGTSPPSSTGWAMLVTGSVYVLRSSSSAVLDVPRTNRATIGDRAFNVSAGRAWNSLTTAVQSSESLGTFRRRLKTELFTRSYSCHCLDWNEWWHRQRTRNIRNEGHMDEQ